MLLFVGNIMVIVVVAIVILNFVLISLFIKWYKKPKLGTAIIRTGSGGIKVCFEKGIFVIPQLQVFETIDLTMKIIKIELLKNDAIWYSENKRIEVKASFHIFIQQDVHNIAKVASTVGCQRAMEQETLKEIFYTRFAEALKEEIAKIKLGTLDKSGIRIQVLHNIGHYLNGYTLDDCVIEHLKIIDVPSGV